MCINANIFDTGHIFFTLIYHYQTQSIRAVVSGSLNLGDPAHVAGFTPWPCACGALCWRRESLAVKYK